MGDLLDGWLGGSAKLSSSPPPSSATQDRVKMFGRMIGRVKRMLSSNNFAYSSFSLL